jgi:hypothetical protein
MKVTQAGLVRTSAALFVVAGCLFGSGFVLAERAEAGNDESPVVAEIEAPAAVPTPQAPVPDQDAAPVVDDSVEPAPASTTVVETQVVETQVVTVTVPAAAPTTQAPAPSASEAPRPPEDEGEAPAPTAEPSPTAPVAPSGTTGPPVVPPGRDKGSSPTTDSHESDPDS